MNFTDRIIINSNQVDTFIKELSSDNLSSKNRLDAFIEENAPGELNFNTDALFEVKEDSNSKDALERILNYFLRKHEKSINYDTKFNVNNSKFQYIYSLYTDVYTEESEKIENNVEDFYDFKDNEKFNKAA
ncbi:hypothetical protein [uncultured Eubacterium sp.]|uniref:hypothetical protein n=1 Tax=uncultured Eubacterium sp. TaxID=165185 RepID=UPI002676FDB4|nr:hypothetical protein [uncultured Eubacterium sp.]